MQEKGERAFIGKVSMDHNSPPNYIETIADSIKNVNQFVNSLTDKNSIIQPSLTTRFVPTCTSVLMAAMSDVCKRVTAILCQSHVSENPNETGWLKSHYPECDSYSGCYNYFGLVSRRTFLAHRVHLTDAGLQLLVQTDDSNLHCPSSNFQLYTGACDV
jgi:guanine deaminase